MDNFSITLLSLALWLLATVFFIRTQFQLLMLIKSRNRLLRPGEIWYQLVPIVGFFWAATFVRKISFSLKKEILDRATDDSIPGVSNLTLLEKVAGNKRPAYAFGMCYCGLMIFSVVSRFLHLGFGDTSLQTFLSTAGLVCWLIYWGQLMYYHEHLKPARI